MIRISQNIDFCLLLNLIINKTHAGKMSNGMFNFELNVERAEI